MHLLLCTLSDVHETHALHAVFFFKEASSVVESRTPSSLHNFFFHESFLVSARIAEADFSSPFSALRARGPYQAPEGRKLSAFAWSAPTR